jgi:hypothetical protein
MYSLLVQNINQNNLQDSIIPYNKGVFCYNGHGNMTNKDVDGGNGIVSERYTNESNKPCNFGGISLGTNGETIELITVDDMGHGDIGFIHCDAQGSENFIFSKALLTIAACRPVIYYEDNFNYDKHFHTDVSNSYPQYKQESLFDIKEYCMNILGYRQCITRFNGGNDNLLIP